MISVQDLYLSVGDYGAKFMSGTSIQDTFNRNMKQVQLEIMTELAPYYQKNEFVRNLLEGWVRRYYDVSDQYGVALPPGRETVIEETGETFFRPLALGVTDANGVILHEMNSVAENEIFMSIRVPQRAPSLTKKRVYYLNYDNRFQFYPSEAIPYILFYLIYPLDANIAFLYTTDAQTGEDIQTIDTDSTVDLSWDESASNLFLFKMLEKYGFQNREQIVLEYGKLGVQFEMSQALAP